MTPWKEEDNIPLLLLAAELHRQRVSRSTNAILETIGVSKSFGGLKALDDVSVSISRGELLGIAGPNGSGKSTLFNVMTNIPYGPSSGEVVLDGERIDRMPAHGIAARGLVRTFQKDAEFPDLSARQTVAVSAVYGARLRRAAALSAAAERLEDLGFDMDRVDRPTTELSVYERKQTMIASALVMNPKILLLDEPASGLTKPEIESLDRLLIQVNRNGVTIVLIEHVLSLLLSVAERLVVLNHGRVLTDGKPEEVIRDPGVVEAYLGKRAG